jgi:DNA repair exonuclease SbcCD nuclease subunit
MYYDNVSVVYMIVSAIHHCRMMHIKIDIHFIYEKVALGHVHKLHVLSSRQFVDIMTKGLHVQLFTEFRSSLCVQNSPASTVGG